MIQILTKEIEQRIEQAAAVRKETILNAPTNAVVTGNWYYVAANGSDTNDGLSPETPWQTLHRASIATELQPGDGVFFRRGDLFRGKLLAKSGVTYAAYGEGPKPILCASPYDGAKQGCWEETDVPHIYRYSEKMKEDVGCLVFDHGVQNGIKATVNFVTGINRTDDLPFSSYRDLAQDLAFYHDLGGPNIVGKTEDTGYIYLRSDSGNPAKRFSSIEFNIGVHGIRISGDNIHIHNLCVQYCGCHGVAAGTVNGLMVDLCQFRWIGGSVQFYEEGTGRPVRFGNAVEIYGGCNDYTVENCYIDQVYDAAITHQFSASYDDVTRMNNIIYKGNLIENCIYSIEYFCGGPKDESFCTMSHVRIFDNIMRFTGMGFGNQRPDKYREAHIKSWESFNSGEDMIIENNIMDRSSRCLLHIAGKKAEWMPIVRKNIFVQNAGNEFARLGVSPTDILHYTEEDIASQSYVGEDNLFYSIP